MPAISRIRLCNVIYENGGKRYNDEVFHLDGQNTVILLENGGGKTVLIQTILQAIIPHISMADRKIKDSLFLEHGPAHIAVEWILQDQPRRYGLTCVSLFIEAGQLQSLKYTYEYSSVDKEDIEALPFKVDTLEFARPATRGEIADYYQRMEKNHTFANTFKTIVDYGSHLESVFKIVPSEWRKIAVINSGEGNVDEFFNRCKTTDQLLNTLLIPVIEEALNTEANQSFAETFEKQREHFKKNQILQEKIDQTQQVKELMDQYVQSFKSYDKAMDTLNTVRAKAHGSYVELSQQQQTLEAEKEEEYNERIRIQEDEDDYRRQQFSYQYALASQHANNLSTQYEALNNQLEGIEAKRQEWSRRRHNIQWTLLQRNKALTLDRIQRLEAALEKEKETLSIQDVQARLDENSHQIHGSYSYELELLSLEIEKQKEQLYTLEQEEVQLLSVLDAHREEEKNEQETLYRARALAEHTQNQMDRIYDGLSDTWAGLDVKQYEQEQKQALEDIQQAYKHQGQTNSEWMAQQNEYQGELAEIDHQILGCQERKEDLNRRMRRIHEASHAVDKRFVVLGYKIPKEVLVYTRQNAMEGFLEEERNRISSFEESLKDRIYQEQIETYSIERVHPDVKDLFGQLVEAFPATLTGDMYLDDLYKRNEYSDCNLWDSLPFSGRTYIVEKDDREAIATWIAKQKMILLDPIYLMTRGEVIKWIEGIRDEERMRLDFIETNGIRQGTYTQLETAANVSSLQEEKADISAKWLAIHDAALQLESFIEEYPYERYQQLTHEIFEQEQSEERMRQDKERIQEAIEEVGQKLEDGIHRLDTLTDSMSKYQRTLEETSKYNQLEETYRNYRDQEEKMYIELSDRRFALAQHQKALEENRDKRRQIQSQMTGFHGEIKRIQQDALYQEVKGFEPTCTNEDRETLIDRRRMLRQELSGLSLTGDQIRAQLEEQRRIQEHYEQQQRRLLKEAEHPLEMIDTFYEQEEDTLYDRMVDAKKQMKDMEESINRKQKELWAKEAEMDMAKKELENHHWEMESFDCDLEHVPKRLRVLEVSIKERVNQNRKREKTIDRRLGILRNMITEFRVQDGKYAFLSVKPEAVAGAMKERLESETERVYEQLVNNLKEGLEVVQERKMLIEELKQSIIDYCKTTIRDNRLKDAMINGLIMKDNYEELLLYQERLSEIIHKTITLAEDDRRESDKELSTFLNHLVTYVELVMHEFAALQDKTRIDVEGEWINIFTFDVPSYTKEEAYDNLRDYLDRMILFVDEKIHRNEEDIRSHIEEALSIKNLIPVVLGQRPIKIKCRKVKNDMKVSQIPTSWEYSNRWSGGEKWSKNMTLFLGILNYLAEKKQYLSSNQKKNRTVILDNPFGKASSKHVLDPVFYIAERLGFQMIALTAHAEGQFITDYFPVVYSLRLRESKQTDKKIVDATRTLNMVYLKEKAPASIERLQEAEQLQLFDMGL